ncbi:hypothetical protein [Chryseobacterium potabilaquae]|nr:hypothetical protein [Chryseobacterium potabilaquae]
MGKNYTFDSNCVIQQHVEIGDNCILGASHNPKEYFLRIF